MNVFKKLYFYNYLDELYGSENEEITKFKQAIFATPKAQAIITSYNSIITKNQEAIEKEYKDFLKKHPKHSKEQEEKFFREMFEKRFVQANDAFLEANKNKYWVKYGNLILGEKDIKAFDSFNKVIGGVKWSNKFKDMLKDMFKDGGGINRVFSNDNLSESYNVIQPDGTIQEYYYTYPKDFIYGSFGSDDRTKIFEFFNAIAPLQHLDDLLQGLNFLKSTTQKEELKKIFEQYLKDQNNNFIESFDAISEKYGIDFPKNDSPNTKMDHYVNRGVLIGLENIMTDIKINQKGFSNQIIISAPYYYPERKKLLDSLGSEGYNHLVKSIKDSLAKTVKESQDKESFETRNKMAMLLALEKDPKILYRLDPRFFDTSEKHSFQIGAFFNRSIFKDLHVEDSHYAALEKQFQKDREELEDNGNANAANNSLAKQHITQIITTSINNQVFKVELNADVDNTDWLSSDKTAKIRGFENGSLKITEEQIRDGKKVNVVLEPDYKTPLGEVIFRKAITNGYSKELLNAMKKEYSGIPNPNDLKQQGIKYSIFANNLDSYALKDPKTIKATFEKNGVHTIEDLLKKFQADPFFPQALKGIDANEIISRLKPKSSTSGANTQTPISLDLAKQLQSALLVAQYQHLIYDQAKKEAEKNPNKDLNAIATDIYQKSRLFPYSNNNMEYQRKVSALFNHFRYTDKGKMQNLGGVSEMIKGFEEKSSTERAMSGLRFEVDPNAKNPYMPTMHASKTGELKNFFGDPAAYKTGNNGLTLTVTPHHKRLAKAAPKTPQYEKRQYLVGSSVHDLSKGLESSVVELDQRRYGSPESLHTIGGAPKSEAMLALAHLSKSLSIDNQDPNAPLSDTLKQRLDDLVLGKATFRTYACVNDQYVEFDRTPGFGRFDISDKMLTETLSRYSKPIAAYIKMRKEQWHIKAPGDVGFDRWLQEQQNKVAAAVSVKKGGKGIG